MWGIDKRWKAGIMKVGGSPCLLTEVIVSWGTMGGYFFSIWIYLENQRNDADDQNAELEQVGISHHDITPLRCSGGGKRSAASSRKRGLPPTVYWQRQRISDAPGVL